MTNKKDVTKRWEYSIPESSTSEYNRTVDLNDNNIWLMRVVNPYVLLHSAETNGVYVKAPKMAFPIAFMLSSTFFDNINLLRINAETIHEALMLHEYFVITPERSVEYKFVLNLINRKPINLYSNSVRQMLKHDENIISAEEFFSE